MDKEELIIELLKESRELQKELSDVIIGHREETHLWQNDTSHRLDAIEIDLREHKEGVIQNRDSIKTYEERFNKRLEDLEAPKKAFKTLFKYAAGLSTLVGLVYGIMKLLRIVNSFIDYQLILIIPTL